MDTRRMSIRRALTGALLLSFVAVGSAFAAESRETFTRSIPAGSITQFDLETGSGDVTIIGSRAATTIEIKAVKIAHALTKSGADERLAEIEIEVKTEGSAVIVRDRTPRMSWSFGGYSVDYSVTAPVRVACRVRVGSGDVKVESVREVRAESGSGNLQARAIEAVRLKAGSGDILADSAGIAEIGTGSGNIRVMEVRSVRVRTGSGDVTVNRAGEVSASAGSGDITVHEAEGSVHAETGSGDISVSLRGAAQPVFAKAGSGDIEILIPPGYGGALDARSSSGSIRAEGVTITLGEHSRNALRGTIGAGGPVMRLSTSSGDITIRVQR